MTIREWIRKHILVMAIGGIALIPSISCKTPNYSTRSEYQFKAPNAVPDYENLDYWAAHPWKKDPSDSVPKPLRKTVAGDSLADVFFLHPTTLVAKSDTRNTAQIDDVEINAKTDFTSLLYQASAFNENTRVFAPRYRQAHIRLFFEDTPVADSAFEIAYADIRTAFVHYLKTYNAGRPIIIASHSQGTKHAGRLLREFFDGKALSKQLVCAYIIGLPVPDNYFTSIPVCTSPGATGCFVTWRSYKKGYIDPVFVAKETFRAVVVNPLSWTTDSAYVSRKKNTGGVLRNFNKIQPRVVNAQIHQNVLWMRKPRFFGNVFLTTKSYHIGDINLFYTNIRNNVRERLNAFLKR